MKNLIVTKFGNIDTSNYPIIKFVGSSTPPSVNDVRDFLEKLGTVIKKTEGQFIFFADASQIKTVARDSREIMAVGLRHLEDEYEDRYLEFIFHIPKLYLIFLLRITTLIVKPAIKQKIFFKEKNAIDYLEQRKQEILNSKKRNP